MNRRTLLPITLSLLTLLLFAACSFLNKPVWTEEEMKTLQALSLTSLPAIPPDPSNAVYENPSAASLGHKLFFDKRFSLNGAVACASCHVPDKLFTDGLPLAQAVGTNTRRTMTLVGAAYAPFQFWDGRKDTLWSQALGPLENPVEHGGNRLQYVHLLAQHYRSEYEALFGDMPDLSDATRFPVNASPLADVASQQAWQTMQPADQQTVNRVFANMGKSIAAYVRLIQPGPARFDAYVQAIQAGDQATADKTLTPDEVAGLRLFIGKAQCTRCHNGPLFTNNDFHNTAVPPAAGLPIDPGRENGVKLLQQDEFNCLGPYSDAKPEACGELRFMATEGQTLPGAFKPPSLRNVAERAPYMHAGQFTSLVQVLKHYNIGGALPLQGHNELEPLNLNDAELAQIEAFLHTLSSPLSTEAKWLKEE